MIRNHNTTFRLDFKSLALDLLQPPTLVGLENLKVDIADVRPKELYLLHAFEKAKNLSYPANIVNTK